MTFWWKKYTKIRKRKVPLDEPNADFVKFAEEVSLKLHDQFTQNPTKNHKQIKTFQKFFLESSAGQRKDQFARIFRSSWGELVCFCTSPEVFLETLKRHFSEKWQKVFVQTEAKCNPINSKKLHVEYQKKLKLSTKKNEKKKHQTNHCTRKLQFREYNWNLFFKYRVFFAQSQYNSYNSEKILLKNQNKHRILKKTVHQIVQHCEMQFWEHCWKLLIKLQNILARCQKQSWIEKLTKYFQVVPLDKWNAVLRTVTKNFAEYRKVFRSKSEGILSF